MNASTLAKSAYSKANSIAPSDRNAEYNAFARVTASLATQSNSDDPAAFARLSEAVFLNRRLWSILAADAAGDGNRLPDDIRASILSLANFIWKHSQKVLRKEASVEDLIEINTAIMRGLRASGTGA
ncbi:flagellar biosynthesis regulator FlaF [Algicella marina]|uniref:Flagellar biosynthesis regulator FlaF n=1 Tax=Algicella marina TaxID=2683284 RepID=A0A6P1T3V1_9RHOB|nr:flagellar biosynthesis regulator FlaF [Algicella marina]QHQ36441.1 flagellar biosynthesis regulator FlaF [Algicella marina]